MAAKEQEEICKVLGFSQEELQERLLNRLVEQFMTSICFDEEGEYYIESPFSRKLNEKIKQRLDETVTALADKHVLPRISELVENVTLQETNKWGESKGQPMTFIEYLVNRAETYMTEQVNHEGKSKEQSGGYSWSGTQTRIAHMIHQHLHYSIETAMKNALNLANHQIVGGLESTVKIKLKEISEKLKVTVKI